MSQAVDGPQVAEVLVGPRCSLPAGEPTAQRLEQHEPEWTTVVWDDPINLMSYVSRVFATYFGYPRPKAHELMIQVHNEGSAVVATGSREEMETAVSGMHSYGLWATLGRVGR
ncbi:ATP-dependent Clp protease adapter ClpS [Acidipropionibacterium jensenii]|uniref:ATP-dependent Clp protease adapter ClpS n=1 Tax=Acidipropionibacterium jensenii TaxID=1749 RepID=UPI00110BF018|nr:ATP-dependent Clp protease adapter ClpS [Acidipropionibacterium jensenii]MDN5977770.1 ATP-dependent Clp protease adapter ClpS [Acidipropionibacterium jensenii]MDN5996399.1 ATP-dependent Clp protease adapter ClpS [Acidipropionibacterium jensenii]MDN6427942.1 ATP-dependent Clp protease adapter ClpS [Acidipropionibacterium jensenii]MDN6442749.1 ATP-dependent Clp protease adapter ClpS [Acidipropionibacterium jensenii]MDN6480714.1 ATP-dependent Clp protease adapter ClpS [Acidipropionibacterium j